jgi:hypothetical protein
VLEATRKIKLFAMQLCVIFQCYGVEMTFQRLGMGSHFAYVEQLMQVSMQQQAILRG